MTTGNGKPSGEASGGLEAVSFLSAASYTFVEEIGRGGMGIVYLALKGCAGVSDLVALKTIKTASKEHAEMLVREANLATQLRHENIVKTYGLEMLPLSALPPAMRAGFEQAAESEPAEIGATGRFGAVTAEVDTSGSEAEPVGLVRRRRRGDNERTHLIADGPRVQVSPATAQAIDENMLVMIAMDYIEGTDCLRLHHEHLKSGYLIPPILTAYIISRVARALDYAHHFVVHRDISPENILINTHGVCKLTDFGIGVAAKEGRIRFGGKLGYMAPEQIFGQEVDERADIYSLGVVAYLLTTGIPLQAPPRKGTLKDRMKAIHKQLDEGYPPPHRVVGDVPRVLSEIISKMIAFRPEDRYLRAAHVARDLEHRVLYAKGFGPTNDSLAAYTDIFDSGFTKYDENQLELLSFLKGDHGGLQLRRKLNWDLYTRVGREMIAERSQYYICRKLAEMAHAERTLKTKIQGRPVFKVRLQGELVETWTVQGDQLLGSNPKCAICVAQPGVLPNHARVASIVPMVLRAEEGDIKDRDGALQKQLQLQEGDRVGLGEAVMYYLHEPPLPAPLKRVAAGSLDSKALLELASFAIEIQPNQVEQLYDLWQQLGVRIGLGEQKQFLLANALVELIDLVSYANEAIAIAVYREPGRVRFAIDCSGSEVGFQRFVSALHRQLEVADGDEETVTDPRFMAIALVRKLFDRIDIDRSRFGLSLVKTHT